MTPTSVSSSSAPTATPDRPAGPPHANEVRLVGRVSNVAERKVLPSGDEMTTFRLVVDRPSSRGAVGRNAAVRVDTFDICCWSARTRRRAETLAPGDTVLVEGSLQRRFYRSPDGPASRYQVDAGRVRREAKAP